VPRAVATTAGVEQKLPARGHMRRAASRSTSGGNRAQVVFVMPVYAANRRDTH
jgi:hypothetical protein